MKKINKRQYSLDVLKTIAIILIVLHHYQQSVGVVFPTINFYGGKFYFGYVVEFFFVLSGYFMYHYIKPIQDGLTFSDYIYRRLSRLLPMVAIGAIAFEIIEVVYEANFGAILPGTAISLWGTVISVLGIQEGWVFANPYVNNPTWYVSVLILCCIILYFLAWLSKKIAVNINYFFVFMIMLGIGINTYLINLPFMNPSSSRGYFAFFFGLLFAQYIEKRKNKISDFLISIVIVTGITLLIVFRYDAVENGLNYIMTFLYYPALIRIFLSKGVLLLFRFKIWGILGKISFEVYIWHIPFLLILYIINKNQVFDLFNISTIIVYILVCFAASTILYYGVENPIANALYRKQTRKKILEKRKVSQKTDEPENEE